METNVSLLLPNDDRLLLKKQKSSNIETELESTIKESTSDLPLGKALNLLVHIHGHIFDKAINTIRHATPAELTVHSIECKIQTTMLPHHVLNVKH